MPASSAVRHARLLRPFPTRRLADTLYRVEQDSAELHRELFRVLTDPPTVPEQFCQALQRLSGLLMSLEEESQAARGVLDEMYLDADRVFETAVRAMRVILAGLREHGDE